MSKKRSGVASSPGNGKTKKAKTAIGALDTFFTSPSKKSSDLSGASTSKVLHDSPPASQSKGRGLFPDEPIILDDDDDLYEDREVPPVTVADGDSPFAETDTGAIKLPMSASGSGSKTNTFQSRNKIEAQPSSEPRDAFPDLTVDPLVFQVPLPWTAQAAPYSFLSRVLAMLSQTRSRILMLNILTNALRMLILHDANSIVPSMYMISNSLAPPYVPVELGLGPMIIIKALQAVSGLSAAALRKVRA